MESSPEPDTPELLERASQGDLPSLEVLLERYLPSVRAYLRLRAGRLLLDKESASDLAQSVCRAVLENPERFRYGEEDGFRRWLFKTAERKVLDRHDYYRAQKRDAEAAQGVPEAALDEARAVGPTPSQEAIGSEELGRLEQAIESLPEEMREVVILTRVVGLSRSAVAAELQKSEGAVRMLLHRALARLAETMARPGASDAPAGTADP